MTLKSSYRALLVAGLLSASGWVMAAPPPLSGPGNLGDLAGKVVAIGNTYSLENLAFSDVYSFNLSTGGLAFGSVLSFSVGYLNNMALGLNITGVSLTDIDNNVWATDNSPDTQSFTSGPITTTSYTFALGASLPAKLTSGYYKFTVSGNSGNGGGYVGGLGVPVPVPEPGTYAMLFAGLGMIGMIALRRRPGR